MENIIRNKKLYYIIIAIVVVIGCILLFTKGLNFGIEYSNKKSVEFYIGKEVELKEIRDIVHEVISENTEVNYIGGNKSTVMITAKDITDEQRDSLKNKINEKYELDEEVNSTVVIENIPAMKERDLANGMCMPILISALVIGCYTYIRYRKINGLYVSLLSMFSVILVMIVFISVYAITRIPVNYAIQSGVLLSIVLVMLFISYVYEKLLILKNNRRGNKNNTFDKDSVLKVLESTLLRNRTLAIVFFVPAIIFLIIGIVLSINMFVSFAIIIAISILVSIYVAECNIIPLWYSLSIKEE